MIKIIEFKIRYSGEKRPWECLKVAQIMEIDERHPAIAMSIHERAKSILAERLNAVEVRWNEKDSYLCKVIRR